MSENPYKIGDLVVLKIGVKDAYGKSLHDEGDVVIVDGISNDGNEVIFRSDVGTHFENVKKYEANKQKSVL